ncbi:MAG: hypothetical protein O2894_05805 [Planctomycetota bacterium]|nr:hypothetical protein [Planctomycetota bacterium]
MPRLTYFEWAEVRIGRIQAVTPVEGEQAPEPITAEQHIKQALQFDRAAARGDDRPVLVYFHWAHDDKVHGKLSTTVCERTLDDEMAARWSKLFRCVQVDMTETLPEYAERIGSKGEPLFVTLDSDLKVVAEIPVTKSGSKLRKAIEDAAKDFPAVVKRLKTVSAEHRELMAEAKKLEKEKDYEEAVKVIDKVRFGDVRVTSEWEKAYAYGMMLADKAERELDK